MPNEKHLSHYTMNTGDLRMSLRSEVADDVVAQLAPMLVPGEHDIPGFFPYLCNVETEGRLLVAEVRVRGLSLPICTFCVYDSIADEDQAFRRLGFIVARAPESKRTPPCILVQLHDEALLHTAAMLWMGDFERCLAWAWIEHRERTN